MKKITGVIVCILLILMMFSIGFAEEEILFQHIPWFSEAVEGMNQLIDDTGFLSEGIAITPGSFSNANESFIYYESDINSLVIANNPKYDDVYYSISYKGFIRKKIAGYAVKDCQMMYVNDGESMKLITVSIDFFQASYRDLQEKLQSIYGEGESLKSEEGICITVWCGANNTCVLLWSEDNGNTVGNLVYGRTDAEQILEDCLQKIYEEAESEDIIGL